MFIKRGANGGILGLLIPRAESSRQAGMGKVVRVDICTNSRLVIMSVYAIAAVQHSIYFKDVAICVGA